MTTVTPLPLTVLVLTYNEEVNIGACLQSVVGWAAEVFVLDSHSTDYTAQLAEAAGARVFYRPFDTYAAQRQHALHKLPISHEWVLFLDADETLTPALRSEMARVVEPADQAMSGYFIPFKFIFMNRWIRYGGYYPTYILRLFRRHAVRAIDRPMDEQVHVVGSVGYLREPFIHHDRKPLLSWYQKHAHYVRWQVEQLLRDRAEAAPPWRELRHQRERKRWVKQRIWRHVPPLLRPFGYFVYRYVLLGGFLDGRAGFVFHFSHALLYQFMIAAVYTEQKHRQEPVAPATTFRPEPLPL